MRHENSLQAARTHVEASSLGGETTIQLFEQVVCGIAIAVVSSLIAYALKQWLSARRERLDLVYAPLFGAVTEIRRHMPAGTHFDRLTVGFPVMATQQYKTVEEVFTRYPHLVKNQKVMQGWLGIHAHITRRYGVSGGIELWLDADIDSWFKEIENEYRKLSKSSKHSETPFCKQSNITTSTDLPLFLTSSRLVQDIQLARSPHG